VVIATPSDQLEQLPPERPVFFCHIPKTAGSTLVEYFRKQSNVPARFWYSGEARTEFLASTATINTGLVIAGGHFQLHEVLPRVDPRTAFLSFVRHPVDRLVSYYRFSARTHTRNSTTDAARSRDLEGFLTFLERERPRILRNQQCRFLSADRGVADNIDVSLQTVQSTWSGFQPLIFTSDRCVAVIEALSSKIGQLTPNTINNEKVSSAGVETIVTEAARERILMHNCADLALFQTVEQSLL